MMKEYKVGIIPVWADVLPLEPYMYSTGAFSPASSLCTMGVNILQAS